MRVEVEWLIHLTTHQVVPGVRALTDDEQQALRQVVEDFGPEQVAEMGEIERVTQHDVKAVEYFLKRRLTEIAPAPEDKGLAELIHFCCTSEDINNLSYALMVKGAVEQVWLPKAQALVEAVATMASDLREVPLLAHTHGQPATPTTMGKELAVLAHRLQRQLRRIESAEYLGKLNGATGTFGAHLAAVPEADWPSISQSLRRGPRPDLEPAHHPDREPRLAGRALRRRRALQPGAAQPLHRRVDLHLDGLLRPGARPGHRRARAPCRTRSTRSASRTPRPTSRSRAPCSTCSARRWSPAGCSATSPTRSMQRNIGTAFGHSLLALDNVMRGLAGLDAVPSAMAADLDANWEVLGEPVQSAMRALGAQGVPGMDEPYERLKELTRGRRITGDDLREFIAGLGLPDDVAKRLSEMTPATYIGVAPQLVDYLD